MQDILALYQEYNRVLLNINYAALEPQTPFPPIVGRECNIQDEIKAHQYLMVVPNYNIVENYFPNNPFMEDLVKSANFKTNLPKALKQFQNLISLISVDCIPYLIPGVKGLSDLVYTANIGFILPRSVRSHTVILSNFRSYPRIPEVEIGRKYFDMIGWNYIQSPFFFEGYADLKPLTNNLFLGGHGIRTDIQTYRWIMDNFPVTILPIKMQDPYSYHLDSLLFVINKENIIISAAIERRFINLLEKYANIFIVDKENYYAGSCESVRIGNVVINHSPIFEMEKTDPNYGKELKRIKILEKIVNNCGLAMSFYNNSAHDLFGAGLSCLFLPLNYPHIEK